MKWNNFAIGFPWPYDIIYVVFIPQGNLKSLDSNLSRYFAPWRVHIRFAAWLAKQKKKRTRCNGSNGAPLSGRPFFDPESIISVAGVELYQETNKKETSFQLLPVSYEEHTFCPLPPLFFVQTHVRGEWIEILYRAHAHTFLIMPFTPTFLFRIVRRKKWQFHDRNSHYSARRDNFFFLAFVYSFFPRYSSSKKKTLFSLPNDFKPFERAGIRTLSYFVKFTWDFVLFVRPSVLSLLFGNSSICMDSSNYVVTGLPMMGLILSIGNLIIHGSHGMLRWW